MASPRLHLRQISATPLLDVGRRSQSLFIKINIYSLVKIIFKPPPLGNKSEEEKLKLGSEVSNTITTQSGQMKATQWVALLVGVGITEHRSGLGLAAADALVLRPVGPLALSATVARTLAAHAHLHFVSFGTA